MWKALMSLYEDDEDIIEESTSGQSLTATVKAFLEGDVDGYYQELMIAPDTDSIYAKSQAAGLTLQQYVQKDPDKAIREAEGSLQQWLEIQAAGSLEGVIHTTEGKRVLSRNMAKLLDNRVAYAQRMLDQVNEFAYTAFKDGEKRKDHLIRTAYTRATVKGDTRMLIYLMDRVDGRPGESKTVDLDYDNAYNVYQIIHTLFDKQLEVLNSGSGTKLICCSRRAGKSHLLTAACFIEALRQSNTTVLYIGQTMENTEYIFESAANKIIDKCKLRDKRGKRLNWRRLDNGSRIHICGLSNTQDPDKILGFGAKIIVVDEFFALKDNLLDYLIKEVLRPMQMDYATEYKFICAGTPPRIKGTYGEYAWKNWSVPHYFWTYKDNPFPVDPEAKEAYVLNELAEMGLDMNSVYARREYGGEWIYDEDLLLYPEFHTYDPREAYPNYNIDMILFGIDYGVSDSDALIGIAWDTAGRRGYVFHEDKFSRLDIKDRTISQLQHLEGQVKYAWGRALEFFPTLSPKEANKRILWDADDSDQKVSDHFNMNIRLDEYPDLRLNIQNAHKTGKTIMFDKIRDLLRTAGLLLIKDGKTANECEKTVLRRGPNGQIYPEVDMKVYHPDILPALRYALWNVIGEESAPKQGT